MANAKKDLRTKAMLQEEAKAKGVKFNTKTTKEELIAAIKKADKAAKKAKKATPSVVKAKGPSVPEY